MAAPYERHAPLDLSGSDFRELGRRLVDRIADFIDSLPERRVTPGESVGELRARFGTHPLPEHGGDPAMLLDRATELLFEHSLFIGHPRYWGFVNGSPAPLSALGDLLASAVNPNPGAWVLAPIATEIEAETVRWIAELLGYPADCGGLLVSGGNMANFVGFVAARRAKAGWDVRTRGMTPATEHPLCIYTSNQTHTWIHKAADLFGVGTDGIRWVSTDARQRMDPAALEEAIRQDRAAGAQPFLVVAAAGTVSTGAVDPLPAIARICREQDLWFHVDGAYGAIAALLPDASEDLRGLALADSLAVDPHKWLYQPVEVGCALVRDARALRDAFSYRPAYYKNFAGDAGAEPLNYYEYGPQNSRGFRALKVWLCLQQAGREGYERMVADDIRLAAELYRVVDSHRELQAVTHNLSIVTFRYVPPEIDSRSEEGAAYLDRLNDALLSSLQRGGEVFLTSAVVDGRFVLRACLVNFHTTRSDVERLPEIVVRAGRAVHAELRGEGTKGA